MKEVALNLKGIIDKKQEEFDNEETYNAIEDCLKSIRISSEKMNTHWSAYLLQTAILVAECWKSGTLVGPSRGSGGGFLLLYMLGITQINPLREKSQTKRWRFLNPERASVLDIDVDLEKKQIVLTGDVSSPIDPPKGCRFCKRCPQAGKRCEYEICSPIEVEQDHYVVCNKIGTI